MLINVKDKFQNITKKYDSHALIADFLFAFDLFANSLMGEKFYDLFSYAGLSGHAINAIVSSLEMVRILILVAQRRRDQE